MYWGSSLQERIALLITAFQTLPHFQITEGQLVMLNLGFFNTVEPLYNGHHWGPTFCPL